MAERTRLELATPGVTGQYSNRLNYRSKFGSPGRIRTYDQKINSLLRYHCATGENLVGPEGFEPTTLAV